jgi:hypothetical protein
VSQGQDLLTSSVGLSLAGVGLRLLGRGRSLSGDAVCWSLGCQ